MQHHTFTLATGQTLHYTAWGKSTAQPVVCVHGLTRNARDFDFLAKVLSAGDDFYVLCIDVLGRGQSSWANAATCETEYTVPNYAMQLLEWLDGLNLVKPHWIGTSMGGIIAMVLQLIAPNRLGKLVLNDIGPIIELSGLQRIAHSIGGVASQFANRALAEDYAKQAFINFGATTPRQWANLCDHYFVNVSINMSDSDAVKIHYDPAIAMITQTNVAAMTADTVSDNETALWASLKSFEQPVRVLRGESSDLLSESTVAKMLECNSQISANTIMGCGHAPHLMSDEQVSVIKDFLNKPF